MRRISAQQVQTSERFYRVPKVFFESHLYKTMSTDAKFAYAVLKDRFELSLKNNWIDKNGDVYLIYTVQELQELLGYGNKKVIGLKKELQRFGLLEEVRQGLNKPNLLYLGNAEHTSELVTENSSNPLIEAEMSKRHFQENQGSVQTTLQEMSKRHTNDTETSDTDLKDYSSRKAGSDSTDSQEKSRGYIPPKYYSLLEVIADKYNGKFTQFDLFEGCFQHYTLTHKQKMLIGQYLTDQYVTSSEVLDMIDRIPYDCEKPLAYLLKMLENLKEERRIEEKIVAHRNAKAFYGGK